MKRVTLSNQVMPIESIWNWYTDQSDALRNFQNKIFKTLTDSKIDSGNKFFGFTTDELNDYFLKSNEELEHLVCFDLISATEGLLKNDFYQRLDKRERTSIRNKFKELRKEKHDKIPLEDVINIWKNECHTEKSGFSKFLGLRKYRDWLAHGRYWFPKFYQPTLENTYAITERLFNIVAKS